MNLYQSPFNHIIPAFFFLIFFQSSLFGQVPVHQEPRHRPVFENKEIRILNVKLPPGDTTLYHVHTTPSVFIHFTSTAVGTQLKGASEVNAKSIAGEIVVEDLSGDNIRTHRVWNRDNSDFHVMDVELLYKDFDLEKNPLDLPDLNLEIDTTWVRVYTLNLEAGKPFQLEKPMQSFLLVSLVEASLQNGKAQNQDLMPGSFIAIPRKKKFSITNSGDQAAELVLLEFPAK